MMCSEAGAGWLQRRGRQVARRNSQLPAATFRQLTTSKLSFAEEDDYRDDRMVEAFFRGAEYLVGVLNHHLLTLYTEYKSKSGSKKHVTFFQYCKKYNRMDGTNVIVPGKATYPVCWLFKATFFLKYAEWLNSFRDVRFVSKASP